MEKLKYDDLFLHIIIIKQLFISSYILYFIK